MTEPKIEVMVQELRYQKLPTVRHATTRIDNPIALEVQAGRAGTGVIGADNFQGAAVAGPLFINHNDAVIRLLGRTNARQTNH